MTFRQHIAKSLVPSAFLRKKVNTGVDLAWADTDVGPLDPLRESDLARPAPAYDNFALTMPAPLRA